jgi:hypothetical protein
MFRRRLVRCWTVHCIAAPAPRASDPTLLPAPQPLPGFPQALAIELTTRRAARPRWLPPAEPSDLQPNALAPLFEHFAATSDWRLALRGAGDPLLFPHWPEVIAAARDAGADRISIETDLLADPADLSAVAAAVDAIYVQLPAATADTYARLMQCDGFERVTGNLARLIALRQQSAAGLRIVPVFVKCRGNAHEAGPWRQTWLQRAGAAHIHGEDAFADPGDAQPHSRGIPPPPELRILADGMMTDELSRPLGRLVRATVRDTWFPSRALAA